MKIAEHRIFWAVTISLGLQLYAHTAQLPSQHPVVVAFKKRQQALRKDGAWDAHSTLNALADINGEIEGRVGQYPYDGRVAFYYQEGGKVYFLSAEAEPVFSEEVPSFLTKRSSTDLNARFKAKYPNLYTVGYERAFDGRVIPIMSPSRSLTEFRDMSQVDAGPFMGGEESSALPRRVSEVPLTVVRTVKHIKPPQEVKGIPSELSTLLDSGLSLSTSAGAQSLPEDQIVTAKSPKYSNWTALTIADSEGQGRTGVLLKDGVPLLVESADGESFVELKGTGMVVGSAADIVHTRRTFRIRSGRANYEQVVREVASTEISSSALPLSMRANQPFAGNLLAEYSDRNTLVTDAKAVPESKLSGQVYRLSSSTRRLAYADNPAFGPRYSSKADSLAVAQRFYGEQFANLRIGDSEGAYSHHSPHPQNFVMSPDGRGLSLTDASDIHKLNSEQSLRAKFPDADQYLIFQTAEGRKNFLDGVKSVLLKRNAWNPAMEKLYGEKFDAEKFAERLEAEVVYPLRAQRFGVGSLVYPMQVQEDLRADQELDLELRADPDNIRLMDRALSRLSFQLGPEIQQMDRVLASAELRRLFPKDVEQLELARKQLGELENDVSQRRADAGKWKNDPNQARQIMLEFKQRQAQAYSLLSLSGSAKSRVLKTLSYCRQALGG